jgi:hypothetical protein
MTSSRYFVGATFFGAVLLSSQLSAAGRSAYGEGQATVYASPTGSASSLLSTPTLLRDQTRQSSRYTYSSRRTVISQSGTSQSGNESAPTQPRIHQFTPSLGRYTSGSSPADFDPNGPSPSASPTATTQHRFDPGVGTYLPATSSDPGDLLRRANLLQGQLRSYEVAGSRQSSDAPAASPGITISNPSGYGADRGRIFGSVSYQRKVRYTGLGLGAFSGIPDGTLGFGLGVGDSSRSVGLQASYTVASFGGSRAPGSGGINLKLHKQFPGGWATAIGGEGIFNFGALPSNSPTQSNDFENTYYGAVSRIFPLQEDIDAPFSRIALTAGVGSGRFRTLEQINQRQFGVGLFGSVALRATSNLSLIGEWTGQDLAAGVSWVPLEGLPLVLTPAFRDLSGPNLSGPRFVMGVGGSLGDLASILSLVF